MNDNVTNGVYLAVAILALAALACGAGTAEENVRILDLPQFICPSSTPRPTHTQPATAVQPPSYATPGPVRCTDVCSPTPRGTIVCHHRCTPTSPGVVLPGATSTPRPTYTPWPTPTVFTISGPYHLGDDVYTGGFASPLQLRLRISDLSVMPINSQRQVVTWEVTLENLGSMTYTALPGAQIFVAALDRDGQQQVGQWWASSEAARVAGIALAPEARDILTLTPGQQITLRLAALTPVGDPVRLGWALDPLSGGRERDLTGGNVAYWTKEANALCSGRTVGEITVPAPHLPLPTATATPTPNPPFWCFWCQEVSHD